MAILSEHRRSPSTGSDELQLESGTPNLFEMWPGKTLLAFALLLKLFLSELVEGLKAVHRSISPCRGMCFIFGKGVKHRKFQ